ncbi:MAG: hypothetical protein WBG34_09290 [Flavobacteriales bacterium]
MAIGWIVVFLLVPPVWLFWELAHGTFSVPARHGEHLLLLIWFIRALFELYGYVKSNKPEHGDLGSA